MFITGTDTGVGKTVTTALLTRHLRDRGLTVAALKPICSGNRDDARVLHAALQGTLALGEINPWHFRAPLGPLLAARRERKRVTLAAVLAHVRKVQQRFGIVLVEGAGGLLSPLGEGFTARELIVGLRATPVIVCPNRLGILNHALLTIEALPHRAGRRAQVVLMAPQRPDAATATNPQLLAEFLGRPRVHVLPRLGARPDPARAPINGPTRRVMVALWKSLPNISVAAEVSRL